MDACNACAVAHGMQRRDVAEADNPLWIDFKLVGRYEIGEVDGSVTTSTTKDCFYLGVKNCLSEVVEAFFDRSAVISHAIATMLTWHWRKPPLFKHIASPVDKFGLDGAGWRYNRYLVARL